MFGLYSRLLTNYPLTTKSLTSGAIFSLGDVLTQKIIQKKADIDWRRNLSLIITGTFYLGPCLHVWYSRLLPQLVSRVTGGASADASNTMASRIKSAIPGTLFDQILFAPIFLYGFFVFATWADDFKLSSAEKGHRQAVSKLWDTLKVNWTIWPAATLINLMFIPVPFRVLYANFIGLFWNMYLSYVRYLPSTAPVPSP